MQGPAMLQLPEDGSRSIRTGAWATANAVRGQMVGAVAQQRSERQGHSTLRRMPLVCLAAGLVLLLLCYSSARAASVFMPTPAAVNAGDQVTIGVTINLAFEQTTGGGFNFSWDPDILTYVDSEITAGDPNFASPGVVSAGSLSGFCFGDFSPISIGVDVGTITFEVTETATTAASIAIESNVAPCGPLVDIIGMPLDVNFQDGTINIIPAPTADLQVSMTNNVAFATPGQALSYVISIENLNSVQAIGASVVNLLPDTLDVTSASWVCAPQGGAQCSAFGSGDLIDTFNLLGMTGLTYTLEVDVLGVEGEDIVNSVVVALGGGFIDADPSNNSAQDRDPITELFADSLESK